MGWEAECDSACDMAKEAAARLRELRSGHELLKYSFVTPEEEATGRDRGTEERLNVELKDRFWGRPGSWRGQPGAIVVAVVMANYALALERAIKEEEAKLVSAP